jgi:hypothetical protein
MVENVAGINGVSRILLHAAQYDCQVRWQRALPRTRAVTLSDDRPASESRITPEYLLASAMLSFVP